jgi:hypothetical protein
VFGYIRPLKPEMKIREFETYRSVYCGLCNALGREYTPFSRLILSYDATFYALFRLSLNGGSPEYCKKRCPFKLFSKRPCIRYNAALSFAADAGVILFYYKLKDDLRDGGLKKFHRFFLLPFAASAHKKAAAKAAQVEGYAKAYIEKQRAVEAKNSANIDEAAHPTAEFISALLTLGVEDVTERRVLERLGYFLGRWVYLIDAADDVGRDLESRCYNPVITSFGYDPKNREVAREKVRMLLNSCVYEITTAYELLKDMSFSVIIKNIIYLGLPDMQENVLAKFGGV